eukprot:6122320-Lingulodinium_polyedra.AAC.1
MATCCARGASTRASSPVQMRSKTATPAGWRAPGPCGPAKPYDQAGGRAGAARWRAPGPCGVAGASLSPRRVRES